MNKPKIPAKNGYISSEVTQTMTYQYRREISKRAILLLQVGEIGNIDVGFCKC